MTSFKTKTTAIRHAVSVQMGACVVPLGLADSERLVSRSLWPEVRKSQTEPPSTAPIDPPT